MLVNHYIIHFKKEVELTTHFKIWKKCSSLLQGFPNFF